MINPLYKIKRPDLKLDVRATMKRSKLGWRCILYRNSRIMDATLGDYSYLGCETTVRHTKIGKFTRIGERCTIGVRQIENQDEQRQTVIGDECFVGTGSIILEGIKIGNNVTIGAGSVVRSNIGNNWIVAGNPLHKLRRKL